MKSNIKKKLSALPQKRPCSGGVSFTEKHGRIGDSSSIDIPVATTDDDSDECAGEPPPVTTGDNTEASVSSQSPNVEVIVS